MKSSQLFIRHKCLRPVCVQLNINKTPIELNLKWYLECRKQYISFSLKEHISLLSEGGDKSLRSPVKMKK